MTTARALDEIDNVVLSGGGIPGAYAQLEALKALRTKINFEKVKRWVGVSIGSLSALMCALKFTDEEAETFLKSVDFKNIAVGSYLPYKNFKNLVNHFGYYENDPLHNIIRNIFIAKKCNPDTMTFADIKALTGLELYVITTHAFKLNGRHTSEAVVYSPNEKKNTLVVPVLLASCALSPCFPTVRLEEKNKDTHTLSKQSKKPNPHPAHFDGGFIDNLPITLFDSYEFLSPGDKQKYRPGRPCINPKTLGIALADESELKPNPEVDVIEEIGEGELLDAMFALHCESKMFQAQRLMEQPQHRERVIMIDRKNVGTVTSSNLTSNFVLSEETIKALRESARSAVHDYYTKKFPPSPKTPTLSGSPRARFFQDVETVQDAAPKKQTLETQVATDNHPLKDKAVELTGVRPGV